MIVNNVCFQEFRQSPIMESQSRHQSDASIERRLCEGDPYVSETGPSENVGLHLPHSQARSEIGESICNRDVYQ